MSYKCDTRKMLATTVKAILVAPNTTDWSNIEINLRVGQMKE